MNIFINLFVKPIKNKILNKILFSYGVIILFAVISLAIIVSNSVSNMIYDKEMVYNKLVALDLRDYFDEKSKVMYRIVEKIYNDQFINRYSTYFEASRFLESEINKQSEAYITEKPLFDNYMNSLFSQDIDILNIIVFRHSGSPMYLYSRNFNREMEETELAPERLNPIKLNNSPNQILLPTFTPPYLNGMRTKVYTISMPIMRLNSTEVIGYIVVDFSTSGFDNHLKKYDNSVKSEFLVITQSQEVIYDSLNQYYGHPFPYPDLKAKTTAYMKIDGVHSILYQDTSNRTDIQTVFITSKTEILKQVKQIIRTIFLVSILCIITVILLSFVITKLFSKRIHFLVHKMNRISAGHHLTERIPVKHLEDEIGQIAVTFNKMCDNLTNYINQVYISEIRQKNAQLAALQAQINPHFLYNTLEAIRMNAIASGDNETSEMIYVLSNLFRSSIKDEPIIDIRDEIEYSEMYLKLFKIRYEDRLVAHFDIQEDILQYGIVKHLLQPVIENYILHGYDSNRADNHIDIKGYKTGEYIIMIMSDNGKGFETNRLCEFKDKLEHYQVSVSGGSIGLTNIQERIKIIYGNHCGIDILSHEGMGTTVTLTILAKTKMELKEHVQVITRG